MDMSGCTHCECSRNKKIWLPLNFNNNTDVEKHAWCVHCGIVKNISDDRPKQIGYWMNILSYMAYKLSLTQCQKRLIAKEIESLDYFRDSFSSYGSSQMEIFNKILSKYCNISSSKFKELIL
jgi:hypothetical protein